MEGAYPHAAPETDLLSLSLGELEREAGLAGEKKFRARQVYEWLHCKLVPGLSDMSNVPRAFRDYLGERFSFSEPEAIKVQVSRLDGTRKYLFRLADGSFVESVYMIYEHGSTVCVSTQVGCRMGCRFCASGIGGLTRNLTAGEMLSQVYAISRDTGTKISNVVMMGTGEPLDNYENAVKFIRMLSDRNGQNMSERNITLSTSGLVPGIRKLKREDLKINLALSLHAPDDATRREIMPAASKYPLREVIAALKEYYSVNRRRITFEYALIHGVNDSDEAARELAGLIRGMNALVNLIPVNPVMTRTFAPPDRTHIFRFKKELEKYGIHVTIRRELGRDIDGACGQLKNSREIVRMRAARAGLKERCTEMEHIE